MSILVNTYSVIIDCGFGASVHGIYDIDGLNNTEKRFISMLIMTLKLTGVAVYDTQMEMHTSTENKDISLAREFQKDLSDP